MENKSTRIPVLYLVIISVLGWFALISQLCLILLNRQTSVAETITRYFSFFTILTNLIVALCVTVLWLKPNSRWGRFFSQPATLTAITVYITIVGAVYNAILRFLWQPKGLQYVTDELLHTIIPILFIILWRLFVNGTTLKYKNILPWLIYPLIYIIYTAIRGGITGYYPYPFIDVTQLGYTTVIINSLVLVIAFAGLSLLLVAMAKKEKRREFNQ